MTSEALPLSGSGATVAEWSRKLKLLVTERAKACDYKQSRARHQRLNIHLHLVAHHLHLVTRYPNARGRT